MPNVPNRVTEKLEAYLRAHRDLIELRGCQGDLQRDERLWAAAQEHARDTCDAARDAYAVELEAAGYPAVDADVATATGLPADQVRAIAQSQADQSRRRQRVRFPDGSSVVIAPTPNASI